MYWNTSNRAPVGAKIYLLCSCFYNRRVGTFLDDQKYIWIRQNTVSIISAQDKSDEAEGWIALGGYSDIYQ